MTRIARVAGIAPSPLWRGRRVPSGPQWRFGPQRALSLSSAADGELARVRLVTRMETHGNFSHGFLEGPGEERPDGVLRTAWRERTKRSAAEPAD